jgi:large subunit ribosomal protein L25
MLTIGTISAAPRTAFGKRVTRKLREAGSIPVIIYGHGEPPVAVSLLEHEVEVALDHGARTLTLRLNGSEQQLLIKDVQYDHLGEAPIHLDLVRFDVHERVTVTVGVELRGVPKGVGAGGVLEQYHAEIEVECLVTDIPGTLHPFVTELELGQTLYARDIAIPQGVVLVTDENERIASVRELAAEVEAPGAEEGAAGEAAQPEVITRGKKEEEGAAD